MLSKRFVGSGNGVEGKSSRRTKSRYSTLDRPADLSLISDVVVSSPTFLQISEPQSDDSYSQDLSPEPRDSRRTMEQRSNSDGCSHRSSKHKHDSDDSDDHDCGHKKKSSRKITEKELAKYLAKKVLICSFFVEF